MKNIFLALVILIVSTSCANLHIEKRRYNRGFHVGFTKKYQSKKEVKEKEALSLVPIDAFTPQTIGNELILESHQPIVDSIQVNTETQPLVSAEIPKETVAKSNQKVVSIEVRATSANTHRIQKTRTSPTLKVNKSETIGHWGSNFNTLSSADSRGSRDVDWGSILQLLLILLIIGIMIAKLLLNGVSVGIVILGVVIVAGVMVLVAWCMSEFLDWGLSMFGF